MVSVGLLCLLLAGGASPAAAAEGGGTAAAQVAWGVDAARPEPASAPAAGVTAPTATSALAASGTAGAATWVFRGAGWGHSLGMSQYGAMEMARDGMTAPQILGHYYTGTTYDAVRDDAVISVNILHGVASASAVSGTNSSAGGGGFTVLGGGVTMTGALAGEVTFTRNGSQVVASCSTCSGATSVTAPSVQLRWDSTADRTTMTIGGTTYRDGYTVVTPSTTGSTLEVVNRVRLHDEYLDYLREMPWSWPAEALKAQAAAARGYALRAFQSGIRSACNCHVYDTTSDQVYGGYPSTTDFPYWAGWKAAVRATGSATTGYVVRSGGVVIQALYSSSHGGRSENNEDVWGGTPLPYLRGVADPWSLRPSNPRASWRLAPSGATVAAAFGLPDVVRVDLRNRTVNGGVYRATATSSTGATATITGEQLRTRVGTYSIAVRHLTSRLGGDTRYDTAAAVARQVAPSATSVVLAAGDSTLVDAAVSGPLANAVGGPLLLTRKSGLPPATVSELDRRGATVRTAFVVGGPGVVAQSVVDALTARGLTVVRVAGTNRYETSAKVAQEVAARHPVTSVVVAGGGGLPDALGASGAASGLGEPILLTPADGLLEVTRSAISTTKATAARIVGGTGVVGDAVEQALSSMSLRVDRLGGTNRWATSRAVTDFYRPLVPSTSQVVLTSGYDANLVDSLVAGTLERLIVLTAPTGLVEDAAASLQRTPLLDTVTAVGGTGAVSNGTLTLAARS